MSLEGAYFPLPAGPAPKTSPPHGNLFSTGADQQVTQATAHLIGSIP
jgi:hypothetical protein